MKKPLQESLQQAVQKAWSEAVSRLQTVEEEVSRRFKQAVDKADQRLNTDEVQRQLTDFGKRLQQNSEALTQRIEENMRSVFAKVKEPLLDELATLKTQSTALKSQAELIGQRIESLLRRKGKAQKADAASPAGGSPGEGDPK
jgi:hypothetical protein